MALDDGSLRPLQGGGLGVLGHCQRHDLRLQRSHGPRLVWVQHHQLLRVDLHLQSVPGAARPVQATRLGQAQG